MEQTNTQFPAEEVTLPSKGLIYPEGSPLKNGIIEMKYMTAKEEDILTNPNLIENGTVIDKLLQSLIVTPIDYNMLLTGDKNAILVAARILGYGADYSFDYKGESINIDLTSVKDKEIDESLVVEGKNEFYFTLPTSKTEVTFKFLTHADERKIDQELKGLKKLNKTMTSDVTTRMKHIITSIDGDYEQKTVREFVDNQLLARDSKSFRDHVKELMPDVKLIFDYEGSDGRMVEEVPIPIGVTFFWPES
jgi:hypothetical protein